MRSVKSYIPDGVGEIVDHLCTMMLESPSFVDKTGYFPDQNIDTAFFQLNEGLRRIEGKLGEDLCLKLKQMSDQMRVHFEAGQDNKTGETRRGCEIIDEMIELLKQNSRKRRAKT
jgi:hypothetical protein